MENFYKFISNQVLKCEFELNVQSRAISISLNNKNYSEPVFMQNSEFTESDVVFLESVSHSVLLGNDIDVNKILESKSILRYWFLITHERYLKNDLVLDKYGRVGFENVKDPFKEILSVPIADILSIAFRKHFGVYTKQKPILYLTSDYDLMNIWDTWTVKDLLKEIYRCMRRLNFKRLVYTICSFLFSRKLSLFNGFLNDKAFVFNEKVKNVAFFIPKSLNNFYDGKINYSDKPVIKFVNELKENGVEFGLHTSFDTMDFPESIQIQMKTMNEKFGVKPHSNRHHYLRFIFPKYLECLQDNNIEYDFSMYYPESLIFRAGISSPYVVWNIKEGKPYNVKIIPTTLMDGTFTDYLNVSYNQALNLCIKKLDLSLKYGSSIVLLWHNSSLFRYYSFNNYHPKLYGKILEYLELKVKF